MRGEVPAGYLYVDGIVGDVGHGVLRDRRVLADEGVVVVIVGVDSDSGRLLTGPEIITRGWVHAPEAEDLLEEAREGRGGGRRPGVLRSRWPRSRGVATRRAPVRRPFCQRPHPPAPDDRPGDHGGLTAPPRRIWVVPGALTTQNDPNPCGVIENRVAGVAPVSVGGTVTATRRSPARSSSSRKGSSDTRTSGGPRPSGVGPAEPAAVPGRHARTGHRTDLRRRGRGQPGPRSGLRRARGDRPRSRRRAGHLRPRGRTCRPGGGRRGGRPGRRGPHPDAAGPDRSGRPAGVGEPPRRRRGPSGGPRRGRGNAGGARRAGVAASGPPFATTRRAEPGPGGRGRLRRRGGRSTAALRPGCLGCDARVGGGRPRRRARDHSYDDSGRGSHRRRGGGRRSARWRRGRAAAASAVPPRRRCDVDVDVDADVEPEDGRWTTPGLRRPRRGSSARLRPGR